MLVMATMLAMMTETVVVDRRDGHDAAFGPWFVVVVMMVMVGRMLLIGMLVMVRRLLRIGMMAVGRRS